MSEFVVFQLVVTVPVTPARLTAWAVDADDAGAAADAMVDLGIFTSGTVYVLDVAAAVSFAVEINPNVTPAEPELPLLGGAT